eukprot:gnl/MRDRNA2_/MRDRNA2_91010_c0_seq1.p1 gnl/MRDRNA2_/MRDRNA2_91010_c0~~gnl/MRDRNA2_/MRDRNA2_91010_c0_seq1.p1  ORF type:complete len:508 (+),score=94.28 gnl/MRDRNA2_/MRDRNA2_91010_c0_seq1:58-1581(+)
MKYNSTRGGQKGYSFVEAVLQGLASDGGLFVPETVPKITAAEHEKFSKMKFPDLSYAIMRKFISTSEVPDSKLKELIDRSYSTFRHADVTPTLKVDNSDLYIMELFHGPTFAFKDVALQFLGNLFEFILLKEKRKMVILGATSGDTGSAAIYGIRGKKNVDCVILFPEGRTSRTQELQMTTVLDDNIQCVGVKGTFDDCQDIVKDMFVSEYKEALGLGAVNSINWARILAQTVYYAFSAYKLGARPGGKLVSFAVPTGNFGDILAGYYAKLMGFPIGDLIIASNSNDVLPRFFQTGTYKKTTIVPTISPSMDIVVSSNFERFLFDVFGRDYDRLKTKFTELKTTGEFSVSQDELKRACSDFCAYAVNEDQTKACIQKVWNQSKMMLCPHTAVGWDAAEQYKRSHPNANKGPVVVLATAHFGKFVDFMRPCFAGQPSILQSLKDEQPKELASMEGLRTKKIILSSKTSAVAGFLKKKYLGESDRAKWLYIAGGVAVAALIFMKLKSSK